MRLCEKEKIGCVDEKGKKILVNFLLVIYGFILEYAGSVVSKHD